MDAPKTRGECLQYATEITLDLDTAHTNIVLSEENRKATKTGNNKYPKHPRRFNKWITVLSTQRMTGRHYWEVEYTGKVHIGVTYDSIGRDQKHISALGWGPESWSVHCSAKDYELWHNYDRTPIPGPKNSRIGVYLDHSAGILAFYSVADTATLLQTVQTTFTEPLLAGVMFSGNPHDYAHFL